MSKTLQRMIDRLSDDESRRETTHSWAGTDLSDREQWQQARKLKQMLLQEYEGTKLLEATDCQLVENQFGQVMVKTQTINRDLSVGDVESDFFLSDLQLIYGIGPVTEKALKNQGYQTIDDLTEHPDWADVAIEVLEQLRSSPESAYSLITKWKAATHPLALAVAGLFGKTDLAFLDIETLGLTHQPIILVGLALPQSSGIDLHQILLQSVEQEPPALVEFLSQIEGREAFFTYNGKRFDLPYLKRRFNFYGMKEDFRQAHFDLYQFTKRLWGDELASVSLNSVERRKLGITREIDIPSSMVPDYYDTYRSTNNPGPLLPLLAHNRQDLLSLTALVEKLMKGITRDGFS